MHDDPPDRVTASGSPGRDRAPHAAVWPSWAPPPTGAPPIGAPTTRARAGIYGPPAYRASGGSGPAGQPARRSRLQPVGVSGLVLITTMTHAPLVMLWSIMPTTYQFSGVVATPLVFGIGGAALLVFAVAYGGLARRIRHSGGLYAFVTHGLGPTVGLGVATLAVLSYSVLLSGALVLLAGVLTSSVGSLLGIDLPVPISVVVAVVAVLVLGRLQLRTLSRIYLALAASQVLAVLWLDFGSATTPDGGQVSYDAIDPAWLLGGSFSLALCLALTSFMGSETGANYADELAEPRRTVPRATLISYAFSAVVLLISGWAISVATGPEKAVSIAQGSYESAIGGNGQPLLLAVVGRLVGPEHVTTVVHLLTAALALGALGTSASIHHSVARQIAALARDGILPPALAARRDGGTPIRAGWFAPLIAGPLAFLAVSVDNTAVALVVGILGGLGIVAALALTSLAAIVYFLRGAEEDETGFLGWEGHMVAAAFALVVTGFVFVYALIRLPSVLVVVAPAAGWLFPVCLGGAFGAGVVWALVLRTTRPEVLGRLGRSDPA